MREGKDEPDGKGRENAMTALSTAQETAALNCG